VKAAFTIAMFAGLVFLGLASLFDLSAFLPTATNGFTAEGTWIARIFVALTVLGGWLWYRERRK